MDNANQPGLYWHVHHDVLMEYCYSYDERANYIKSDKPEHEIELRLRLFKPVKATLGDQKLFEEYVVTKEVYNKAKEAYNREWEVSNKAWKVYNKACEVYNKACEVYNEVWKVYNEVWKVYNKAWRVYFSSIPKTELETAHNNECPNCPWDGETIFCND